MIWRFMLIAVMAMVVGLSGCPGRKEHTPPPTVPAVDLNRYLGTWYEIARIPHRFQQQCVSDVSATYTRRVEGGIHVLNRCRTANGKFSEARAIARVVDTDSNAKLEVSFFSLLGWRPVWGQYWILELGKNYEYAIVGDASRRYGWILARRPGLAPPVRQRLDQRLRGLGYDPRQFIESPHTPAR